MRLTVLGVIALAACSEPPAGALIVVTGAPAFDQVEVYFGKPVGDEVPTTPNRPASISVERGLLVERLFEPFDAPDVFAEPTTTWSYFVPTGDANRRLGDYVLVIARNQGRAVGIGELFHFEVPDEEAVYRFEVPLVDIANEDVEEWGSDRPCVRWTRDRGDGPQTVAVVHRNDSDCDNYVDHDSGHDDEIVDCMPLRYCDGTGTGDCVGSSCLESNSGVCTVGGSCINKGVEPQVCRPTACADDRLCDSCDRGDPASLVACAIGPMGSGYHTDHKFPLGQALALCTEPFNVAVPLGIPCVDPKILDVAMWYSDSSTTGPAFKLTIAQRDNGTGECLVTITPEIPGSRFIGVPHMLVEVTNPAGAEYTRSQFILALEGTTALSCPGATYEIPESTFDVDLSDCAP